jgi:MFS superfamily sulfate permease-like transporter
MTAGSIERSWRGLRFDRHELAGSLGDLGTFLPLLVGMSQQNGLDFAAALLFAGAFNVVTALTFGIPMAVQPMKAIAAIALAEGLTASQIVAAGMGVSAVVLLLGWTGAIELLHGFVSKNVVRGLQLALGLSLAIKGVQMVGDTGAWLAPDGYATAIAATAVVVLLFASRHVPPALVLFAGGIALAVIERPNAALALGIGFDLPRWSPPPWSDFESSFVRAALPQIPLTTLNSVVAVCALSADLFPERPAAPRKVAVSVGLMNLIGGWFGAMPMCHGAGGLAGQHRFGARTGGSILALGVAKVALAVLFGATLMSLAAAFPASILGVMLAFSGLELALVVGDRRARGELTVALATAAACIGFGDFALGFALGIALDVALRYSSRERS